MRIVDLPGVELDADVRGKQAYHLLSVPAIIHYAQATATALELPPAYHAAPPDAPEVRRAIPRHVDAALSHPRAGVRAAAEAIARRLGRNLAFILLALRRGDRANRATRPDLPPAAWERWARVTRWWLGGGPMSGTLGERIVAHAQHLLNSHALERPLQVARTPWPHDMALRGVARYLPSAAGAAGAALCMDYGQTSVKSAVVFLQEGALVRAQPLPPQPVPWRWRNDPEAGRHLTGAEVLAFTSDALAAAWRAAQDYAETLAPYVPVSIAAYMRGGELLGNGMYARMQQPGVEVTAEVAGAVAERGLPALQLALMHDGTAAAALHAAEPQAAVLVVGTALGVGFTDLHHAPALREWRPGKLNLF